MIDLAQSLSSSEISRSHRDHISLRNDSGMPFLTLCWNLRDRMMR